MTYLGDWLYFHYCDIELGGHAIGLINLLEHHIYAYRSIHVNCVPIENIEFLGIYEYNNKDATIALSVREEEEQSGTRYQYIMGTKCTDTIINDLRKNIDVVKNLVWKDGEHILVADPVSERLYVILDGVTTYRIIPMEQSIYEGPEIYEVDMVPIDFLKVIAFLRSGEWKFTVSEDKTQVLFPHPVELNTILDIYPICIIDNYCEYLESVLNDIISVQDRVCILK